jgi:formylmethanofuran dehydrogenase subunit C
MSALTLRMRQAPPDNLDMSPLTPERLEGLSPLEIARLRLSCGNALPEVGELFDVNAGDADHLVIAGSSDRFAHIGAALTRGSLTVEGDVGPYCAAEMAGGSVSVRGNCGASAATGMRDGSLSIAGNAGDFLGGARPGSAHGLAGGTVLVFGHAGNRVGDRMRRGILCVGGGVGAHCAARMLAGTIVVHGMLGTGSGLLMRRGTLIVSAGMNLPDGFEDCGLLTSPILTLIGRHLATLPGAAHFAPAATIVRRAVGDRGNGGLGEILMPG